MYLYLSSIFKGKVLESCHCTIAHIGNVLIAAVLSVRPVLREIGVIAQPPFRERSVIASGTILPPEVAGNTRLLTAFSL